MDYNKSDSGMPQTARLRRYAWLLDSSIELPGGLRIGADGIIGLIPGIGDGVAAALSSYILIEAAKMEVPRSVLLRMALNIVLELVVGTIPIFGDIFDFIFKANERNVVLLEDALAAPQELRRRSRWFLAGLLAILTAIFGGALFITISLVQLLWATVFT